MSGARATKREIAEVVADRDWWQAAGDVLNLHLSGWDYRESAIFCDRETNESVYLTGRVGERLHKLSERSK